MKAKMWMHGVGLVCLLSCLLGCTKAEQKPLQVHAADPIVVTQTRYVELSDTLTAPVEAAWGFVNVWVNGDMYGALVHDSAWLTTCRAQIDGIRAAYAAQAATQPVSRLEATPKNGSASAAKEPRR